MSQSTNCGPTRAQPGRTYDRKSRVTATKSGGEIKGLPSGTPIQTSNKGLYDLSGVRLTEEKGSLTVETHGRGTEIVTADSADGVVAPTIQTSRK